MNYSGIDRGKFLDYTASNDFALYEVGFYKCQSDYSYGPVIRDHTIFHYVISGQGILVLEGETFQVHAGEGFLIPGHTKAYYKADTSDPWEYAWIHVDGPRATELFSKAGLNTKYPVYTPVSDSMKIYDIINEIYDKSDREIYCYGKVYEFFDFIVTSSATPKTAGIDSKPNYVKNAVRFISLKYSEPIGVKDIAEACGLNRSYLTRLFKQEMGMAPQEYLLEFRLKKAAALLRETDENVGVIAYMVGYVDVFTFSKAFKRVYGMAPREYREKGKQ